MKITRLLAAAAFSVLGASTASAQVNVAVPTNAFITFGGFDWAWASPLSTSSVNLTFQSQFGWRLPTAQELLGAPQATQFLFPGANVPFGGADSYGNNFQFTSGSNFQGDGACAAAFFSNSFVHCDYGNAPGSAGGNVLSWNGPNGVNETLVVRPASNVVPEPSTYALMAAGLAAMFAVSRRKRRA